MTWTPNAPGVVELDQSAVYYETFGDPSAPLVVFCNGAGQTTESWRSCAAELAARGHRILLWDFPGTGRSTSKRAFTISFAAETLDELLDALELGATELSLACACIGCGVGVLYALGNAGRVRRVALTGAVLTNEVAYRNQRRVEAAMLARDPASPLWKDWFRSLMFSGEHQRALAAQPEALLELGGKLKEFFMRTTQVVEAQDAFLSSVEALHPELGRLRAPVLVIAGEHDVVTPTFYQERASALFGRARLLRYPNTGHLVWEEDEARFSADLHEFFTS